MRIEPLLKKAAARLVEFSRILLPTLAALCLVSVEAFAAALEPPSSPIEILSTRVIYDEGEPSATLSVRNNGTISYLLNLTVEPFVGANQRAGRSTEDFMTSPAIRVIRPGEAFAFRIVRLQEKLPQDIESLYVLALRILPSQEALSDEALVRTRLVLSLAGRLKLFFRPRALANAFGVEEVRATLQARCSGSMVTLSNGSPYWGTIEPLSFDGQSALQPGPKPMIAPKAVLHLPVARCPRSAAISLLSENGIATPIRHIHVEAPYSPSTR